MTFSTLYELNFRHTPNWGHGSSFYSLQDDQKFSSLNDLIAAYQQPNNNISLDSVCLIPNPVSDKTVLRAWEIQTQADRWMIPR